MTRFVMPVVSEVSSSEQRLTDRLQTEISSRNPGNIPFPDLSACEWIVDAGGCDPDLLRCVKSLRTICESVIGDLGLRVVGEPQWHQFPGPGGVTGLYLLAESHLSCHTWPEHQVAAFNLFCCRHREEWPWNEHLKERLQAGSVQIRAVSRGQSGNVVLTSVNSSDVHSAGLLR